MNGYPRETWRLIRTGPADGPTNMALDEAILRAVADGGALPTLRFYAWEPGCLSLGRGQPVSDVDLRALEDAGLDLVRRPTGGRAILHVDELTYSVVAPRTEPRVAGDVVDSYRRLSAGLVRGLERLGVVDIAADRRVEGRGREGKERRLFPVCFEVPADYEITVGGRKLVGSAQMRSQGVVLQHGALPLHGDITRICPLLAAHPDPARVRARATTVEEALGRLISWGRTVEALTAGFAEALNLRLEPGELTDEEQDLAKKLRAEKYAADEWTKRV